MDSNEFIRRARRYARTTGQEYRLDRRRGKGSHVRLYIGRRFTTLKRGELSKGVLAATLRQLGSDGKEFGAVIYAYPCDIASEEGGGLAVTFSDVPEAITGGRDRTEALRLAADALSAALAGYVRGHRDIPQPSIASSDQELVAVPAVMTAKLALYSAIRSQGITESELARRLGVRQSAIRKLTNPERRSRIDRLQEALDAVGCQLVIDVTAA